MDKNMKMYATIYHVYRTALFRTLRLLIFSLLAFLIIYQLSQQYLSPLTEFFFNLFVIIEIFFNYKISRMTPVVSLAHNNGDDIYQSFTLAALTGFITHEKGSMVVKSLLRYPQIRSFLQKANITQKEIVLSEVDKDELAKKAFAVAGSFQGQCVTSLDV